MRHFVLTAFVFVLATALGGPVTAQPAGDPPTTEAQFKSLQQDFQSLYQSLQNLRGISERDRAVIGRFRQEVNAFTTANPEHIGGLAMELQLSQWMKDESRVAQLFEQLMLLRPDDPQIAMAWLRHEEQDEEADPEALLVAYRRLVDQFPDNTEVRIGLAEKLQERMEYGEAIDLLTAIELDPTEQPEAVFMLAELFFAEHFFAAALERLQSIPKTALSRPERFGLRREVEQLEPVYEEYISNWEREQQLRADEAAADDLPLVEIYTDKGRILVQLFENQAPNTVANFVTLAESGFYAGTRFHRFIPNFMVQGGDPNSRPDEDGTPGTGGPGYTIPDEHGGENDRLHFNDSLAMAKQAAPNTGGSQFYFTHRPTHWLNGKHTVFGRVLEGQDVVRSLRQDDAIQTMLVLRKRDHLYEPETIAPEQDESGDAGNGTPGTP
jgi:cyclophilin family peptidyl-prolyl cis-trans isomerase